MPCLCVTVHYKVEFDAGGDEFYQGRIDPLKVGRGHATPIEPVQMVKCSWLLIITLQLSL